MNSENVTKQIGSILLLPGAVMVLIPGLILFITGTARIALSFSLPCNILLLAASLLLVSSGSWLLFRTITLFVAIGQGTLAPWQPPMR